MAEDLSAPLIEAALDGSGREFRYFDEIGSTNTEAMVWAASGGPEGGVVVADHQTGGRGRWDRTWFSSPGRLLQFSLILRPDIEPASHGLITAGLGVAVARAIRSLTELAVEIKWPNDVVFEGRKLAGMLVESTMRGSAIDAAICGIGINVHLEADELPRELRDRASSLAIELDGKGTAPRRVDLLAAILREIERLYPAMTGDASTLLDEARDLSSVLGREVVIRAADGSTIEGTADGFGTDGALRLIVDGEPTSVHVGEIEQLRTS